MVKICRNSLLYLVALLVLRWEVVSAMCRGYGSDALCFRLH
jgi:hypothetical protein